MSFNAAIIILCCGVLHITKTSVMLHAAVFYLLHGSQHYSAKLLLGIVLCKPDLRV